MEFTHEDDDGDDDDDDDDDDDNEVDELALSFNDVEVKVK